MKWEGEPKRLTGSVYMGIFPSIYNKHFFLLKVCDMASRRHPKTRSWPPPSKDDLCPGCFTRCVVNAAFPLSFPSKRDKQNSSGSVSSPPPPQRWSNHARDIVWLGVSLGVFSLRVMMRLRVVVVSVWLLTRAVRTAGDVVCAVAKLTLSQGSRAGKHTALAAT